MRFLFSFFHFFLDCHTAKQAYIHYLIDHLHNQREIYIYLPFDLTKVSIELNSSRVQNKQPPLHPLTSHLIQPQNHTLIIPRLPIQIQPRRHITFPPIRPIIRTIPIPRIRLQPLQSQRRRCRFNHGELLKCENNRGGFVRREELDRGPVVG